MKMRTIVSLLTCGLLTLLLASSKVSAAQEATRTRATMHPCPSGKVSMEAHPVTVPGTLDQLVYGSKLIVVGTVSEVLPAYVSEVLPPYTANLANLRFIKTNSRVSVEEVLFGTLPPGVLSFLLGQMGGKAGPCELVVPNDPLVHIGGSYVLFLFDRTELLNGADVTRYFTLGNWAGKAQVVDGKIQFLPSADERLHQYDNMDAREFIALVRDRIRFLRPSGR